MREIRLTEYLIHQNVQDGQLVSALIWTHQPWPLEGLALSGSVVVGEHGRNFIVAAEDGRQLVLCTVAEEVLGNLETAGLYIIFSDGDAITSSHAPVSKS